MSATIKTIVTLFTITLLSLAVSIYSSYKLKASNDELVKVNSVGLDYQAFKSTWLNKEYSKNHIDALTADMGKGYFSAVVTKKELKGDIYTVGIMVLNSDEFDAITRRILNSNLKINKLDIINNDVDRVHKTICVR